MPYSDFPPAIVMPDTPDGHYEGRTKFPGVSVKFCGEWLADKRDTRTCANRRVEGDRCANWCLRCLAGYPALSLTQEERDSTRLGGVSVTGW